MLNEEQPIEGWYAVQRTASAEEKGKTPAVAQSGKIPASCLLETFALVKTSKHLVIDPNSINSFCELIMPWCFIADS